MTAVAEETGIIDASRRRSAAEVRKGYVRFCEGDVIFAKITPCMENGKTAPVIGIPGGYAAGSTEFHVLRPEAVEPRYLWYWLVRHAFRHEAERNMSGSAGQLRVPVDYLRKSRISVAPLAEQRRIVARIDELFAEIAEGEAALQRARQGLDTWRRALLKAAVTGELTRDWREANRPAKTGAGLLARIRTEREAIGARHFRKRRGTADLPLDTSDLPALPEGWVWARLSELGTFGRGKSKHRPRDDPRLYGGDVPFVQTGIVAGAGDYIKAFNQTYSELGVAQSHIWPAGTLCITIAANIAKTAILAFEACFPDSVVGLFPDHGVDAYFIHMWMQTIQSRLEAFAPATAQKNINLEVLHNVVVPLPSTEEQLQIIDRFRGALDAVCDCVETVKLDKDRDALCQSILKAAFEGRLVPQDPADEPAAALLARLRDGHPGNGARRRRAQTAAGFSHPSVPGLTRLLVDPRVEPADDE
jgi:type I restriction enzyme S subunit